MAKYACKKCGAELYFDPAVGKLHCEYCDSLFDPSEFDIPGEESEEEAKTDTQTGREAEAEEQSTDDSEGELVVYSCPNCGAEIITSKKTAATTCVYCNKAITLEGNLSGVFKPDYVLPFKHQRDEVEQAYLKLCKSSILTPPAFTSTENIKKIKGVYIPFWLHSFTGDGDFNIHAENRRTWREGKKEITEVSEYRIHENVEADFTRIPTDALSTADDDMMDSIEPFEFEELADFNPAYLAGFYTQRWDVTAKDNESRAQERAKKTLRADALDRAGVYSSKTIQAESFDWTEDQVESAMLPVWMMNTEYKGKTYTFGMNGQTGKLMGKLPTSWARVIIASVIGFALGMVIAMFLRMAGIMKCASSGSAVIPTPMGLLVGLIVMAIVLLILFLLHTRSSPSMHARSAAKAEETRGIHHNVVFLGTHRSVRIIEDNDD